MKGLEKFMVEVFPWKTITIMVCVIAACDLVQTFFLVLGISP
jgi:hypothetical protein